MTRPAVRLRALASGALAVLGLGAVVLVATHQQRASQPAREASAAQVAVSPSAGVMPGPPNSRAVRAPALVPASVPTRIDIPGIGVSSALLRLGQAADGSVAVPPPGPTYDLAGWYRYSPTPGSLGPAVIVGHIDSKRSGPSVFFRLGDLRPRDVIRVARTDGSVAVFAVDAVRRFAKADFPTALVYGNTDHAALRLITCGGPFDASSGQYEDNIIVTASLTAG